MRFKRTFLAGLLDLNCAIQQIPSPTFCETPKAEFVAEQFRAEGLQDIHLDRAGNALARLPGGDQPPLIVSAHMDTVFPTSIPLTLRREPEQIFGPSIGDNSLGVAALASLPRFLREESIALPGDLWLVGNVGEEGLGDLRGMRAVVDSFGGTPVAYLVLEGMGLGHIYHRGLGVERYRITARTPGGHSWVDYGKPSAIHVLATLITRLTAMSLPRHPRTTMNVGRIEGGTSINTIAAQASLELDLRSEDNDALKTLSHQVKRLANEIARNGVKIEIESIGKRPSGEISDDHPLVLLAENALREEGVQPHLEIASTDANIPLSRGFPAICIGLTSGGNAHTQAEYLDIEPVNRGMGQVLRIVTGVWKALT